MPEIQRVINYGLRAFLLIALFVALPRAQTPPKGLSLPSQTTAQVAIIPLGTQVSLRQQSWVLWMLARQGWSHWRWFPPQALPPTSYSKRFRRYRAERLTDFLAKHYRRKARWVIGITNEDISTELRGFLDHAVLGLTDPTHATIVLSSARLPKKTWEVAWRSLILHEWGHLFGLVHCPDASCVMFDRLGQDPALAWSEHFCATCEQQLRTAQKGPLSQRQKKPIPLKSGR